MRDDHRAEIIGGYVRNVDPATAADTARRLLDVSDSRDDQLKSTEHSPLPILNYDEWQARLRHECAHAESARHSGAPGIDVLVRDDDGTGWCSYGPIENPLDAITTHLVGVAAEAKYYPPSIHRYAAGCFDFLAARLLIDKWNERGEWPKLTFEAAARRAVEFVDSRSHWRAISNLALALGSSGTLCDHDIRAFARSGYVG